MSNTLFVLLDGAEDDPNPLMDGRKPYEVAEMPYLESMAPHRLKTTGRGYTQLFLNEFFTGHPPEIPRAALEALGLGLPIQDPRRTAYRLSPATVKDGMVHWYYNTAEIKDELEERIMSHMDMLSEYDPAIRFFIEGRAVLTMVSDDVPDLPLLMRAGLSATPADGIADLDDLVDFRSRFPGGRGAVRELAELILRAQDRWDDLIRQTYVEGK